MRKLLFLTTVAAALIACSCSQPKGYTLEGKIDGELTSNTVYLIKLNEEGITDSATIQNGQFKFQGEVQQPTLVYLIFNKNEQGKGEQNTARRTEPFYLENAKMTYSTKITDVSPMAWDPNFEPQGQPIITGSTMQALSESLDRAIEPIQQHMVKLNNELYGGEEESVSLEREFQIAHEMDSLRKEYKKTVLRFVTENANTIVGFDRAQELFQTLSGIDMTKADYQQIAKAFSKVENTAINADTILSMCKLLQGFAVGEKFPEATFTSPEGKSVALSTLIEPGKYTLLEFWASWCSPCRAEMPHLKEVYGHYAKTGKFQIVSVSVDRKDSDWRKAMEQIQAPWPQLIAEGGFQNEGLYTYYVTGIPFGLLIGPDGTIIAHAALREKLEYLLHKNIGE